MTNPITRGGDSCMLNIDWANYLIQLAFLSLSYFFGQRSTKIANQRISYMERYDNLYSPLIDLIVKNTDSMDYEDGEYTFYRKIYSLVWENLKYVGETSIPVFSNVVYDLSLYQDLNIKEMKRLTLSLLKEGEHLEKILDYPTKSRI